jgi:hypothetical protein
MTKLAEIEKRQKMYPPHDPRTDGTIVWLIARVKRLENEMRGAMKYYESCGEESDPEFQLFRSFKKALEE